MRSRWPVMLGAALTLAAGVPPSSPAAAGTPVEIRGKDLYVEGRRFLVKGVHYGPWRPGAGPRGGHPYPGPESIDADLHLIRQLNANAILVVDPPEHVLDLADKHGLKVLYSFSIEWWTFGAPAGAVQRASILERVERYRDKRALLAWILGHEIPTTVLDERGSEVIRTGLTDLYQAVKALDARHPVTHSNWPLTRDLDLRFFDLASFNLYPLWPPEVVARGFGKYVEQVLQPVAGAKPLLLTEFGINTLEAGEDGQARLLRESWNGLVDAGACGGVVFEFADEWWKNYDNPIRAGNWWQREAAPDDEKRHDLDPEEYYGIMTSDRRPRAAFSVVASMFAANRVPRDARILPATIVGSLIVLSVGTWLWTRRTARARAHG